MASGTYTLTNIQRQHTCVVSWSTSRSSSTSTSVTVSLTLKITCGTYTDFSSPAGDSDLCINGSWDGGSKGGYGGVSLTKGKSWSKTYSKSITWASSSNIPCQVYVDYYAGGWGPSVSGGTTQSFSVSVPSYVSYTKVSTPTWKSGNGANFYGNLAGGDGKVTVTWNASSAGTDNSVTGYIIQAQYPGGSWYEKWNSTGTSATLQFDGLSGSNCAIKLRIQAKGSAGTSYYSNWSSEITVNALGRSKCSAPTSITIRSTSSSTSTVLSTKDCGSGNFYIHWSAGTAGLNNAIQGYSIYYRDKTSGATSWTFLRTISGTSTRYTTDNWSTSHDYEYTVRTNGVTTSYGNYDWNSTYGTNIATIGMVPTNPTSVTFTNGGTYNSLVSINHPTLGSSYLAGWTQLSSATALTISGTMSGASGVKNYRIYYGIFSQDQAAQGTSPPSPSVVGWTSLTSTATSTTLSFARQRIGPGQVLRFRIDTVGYNGRISSGYYYSPCIVGAGTTAYKMSGVWKYKSIPYVKVGGVWKTPVMVWRKVGSVWKQTF